MTGPREMPGAERANRRDRLLASAGWGEARRTNLAGDASFRRYERVQLGRRTAVLMDAPAPMEDVRPFVHVARRLTSLGLSAPRVLAVDIEAGFLLLEDLGDDTYTRVLARGADEHELYRLAINVLIDLHHRPVAEAAAEIAPYDDELLRREAGLLIDWYLPALTGKATPEAARRDYFDIWTGLFVRARLVPETLVLRDYHVDNLVWLPDRPGVAACGLLDFQDAVRGPVAYDVVSLLEDVRRDIEPGLVIAMRQHYLDGARNLDAEAFAASYAALGVQRNCKIVGIFTRLCVRDGKPQYLKHIPRTWRLIEHGLRHPDLRPMRIWLDRHIPPGRRVVPPALISQAAS